jgi:hypothetical protein
MTTTMDFFARTCFYDACCFIPTQRRRAVSNRGLSQRHNTTFTACEPCAARRCLPHPLRAALRAWGSRISRWRWPPLSAWQPRPSRACVRCCTRAYSRTLSSGFPRLLSSVLARALSDHRDVFRFVVADVHIPLVGMLLTHTCHFSMHAYTRGRLHDPPIATARSPHKNAPCTRRKRRTRSPHTSYSRLGRGRARSQRALPTRLPARPLRGRQPCARGLSREQTSTDGGAPRGRRSGRRRRRCQRRCWCC